MNNLKNLIGQRFGKLTVIKRVGNDKNNRVQYLCKCECGSTKIIRGSSLTSGNTKSCGCNFGRKKTQSFYGTRLYRIWANIKSRCTNPKYIRFEDYGGRGINICDEWKEFNNFKDWALKLNIDYILLYNRIVIRKWSFEKAINTPIMTNGRKKSA